MRKSSTTTQSFDSQASSASKPRRLTQPDHCVYIGTVVHCDKPYSVQVIDNGYVITEKAKIIAVGNESALEEKVEKLNLINVNEVRLAASQLLIPGLIDTHIHAPQYPNIGLGYDQPLLEWLSEYTYKVESHCKDLLFSENVYNALVLKTLGFGTTTACYFGSMYTESCKVLVDIVLKHGQRAMIGKINMTKMCPDYYKENSNDESIRDTRTFLQYVEEKKNDLVKALITPRFALSVDMNLMQRLSELAVEFRCGIQTHIAENLEEVAMVNNVYGCSYAEVYDRAKLLTNNTILAHGIHLLEGELKLISERGASISHCPTSNTRLKSGECDLRKLIDHGITIGLGTDVAAGDSASIIDVMKHAIDTSIHLSFHHKNYVPINCYDAFYLATLGGAKALGIEELAGNFEIGKDFDALIIDMNVRSSDHLGGFDALDLLQKFIYTGDDRNIKTVYVSGRKVKDI